MSQLPEQLLKSSTIPLIMPLNQNMGILNPVPLPPQMQAQPNMVPNPNIPIGTGPDPKSGANIDTSNYLFS